MNTIPEDLPELPKPSFGKWTRGGLLTEEAFTAQQMQDYAREAVRLAMKPAPDAAALVEAARDMRESMFTHDGIAAMKKFDAALAAYDQQTGGV